MNNIRALMRWDLDHPNLMTNVYADDIANKMEPILSSLMRITFKMNHENTVDMDIKCGHHQFDSIEAFLYYYIAVEERQNGYECVAVEKNRLMGKGCCKRCALYIAINLWSLSRKGVLPPVTDSSQSSNIVAQIEDGDRSGRLVLLPLDYLQCSKLMLSHSKMWVQYFGQLMAHTATLCQLFQKVITGELDLREDFATINRLYHNLQIIVWHGVDNLHLLRPRHWVVLLTRLPGVSHLDVWLQFVGDQMTYGFHHFFDVGLQCMMDFLVLICYAARQIQSKWYRKVDEEQKFSKKRLKRWSKDLRSKWEKWPRVFDYRLYLAFGWIAYAPFTKRLNKIIRTLSRELYDKKWNEMQCQNEKCDVRGKYRKLRKCAHCGVVRYCSRGCQKVDWIEGGHRLDYNRLHTLQAEHAKLIKKHGGMYLYDRSQQSDDENTLITFDIQC